MPIKLPYGKSYLNLDLSPTLNVKVIEPQFLPALPDPKTTIQKALRTPVGSEPLVNFVRLGQRVGIIVNDITRATPTSLILEAILAELWHIPASDITIFAALGSHRENTLAELREMVSGTLVDNYRIVQNMAFDRSTQVHVGTSSLGHEIWLNREMMACDVKILTGFIEPHFFAGFSGGGKAVMPGMAGIDSILDFHSFAMIGHPKANWGITTGNPVWEEAREVGLMAGKTFLVNVGMNKNKEITGVYAGSLVEAHDFGCSEIKKIAMVDVRELFDIVITTNSGYPLDQNLYQSVKGMSAAAQIVRPGGTIVIATACSDGIPEHGLYGKILMSHTSPREILDELKASQETRLDMWQVQKQALVQLKADVYVYSDGLSDDQIRNALFLPCHQIEETIAKLISIYGTGARICVIPEGPQTIPYFEDK